MNRLAAYEEVLTIIADRHGLYVYFDFDIDINVLRFRFYLNDCEIYKGCLKLSEIISHNVFELLEKEVEKRIERLKGKPHDKKGDEKMTFGDFLDTLAANCNLKVVDFSTGWFVTSKNNGYLLNQYRKREVAIIELGVPQYFDFCIVLEPEKEEK